MKGLGILILVVIVFAAGVFTGGYLTGHSPEEMVEVVKGKFQVEESATSTSTTPPAKVEVCDTASVGLRVRATPLIEKDNILGKVFDRTRFSVIGGPERGSGYKWLKVRLEGWAAANWLSPAPTPGAMVVVEGTGELGLRVREAPFINDNVMGKVYDATKLLVLEGPASGSGYYWWRVKLEGWSASRYLREPTTPGAQPTPTPKESKPSELTSTIEVANLDQSELIELRKVLEEVLTQAKIIADEDQKRLLYQADIVVAAIKPSGEVKDLLAEKTKQERFILDALDVTFSIGAQYFYKIPSPVAGAIAKGAEELGKRIAEWQVLGQLSFARVTLPNNGVTEIVYQKRLGEIWANIDVRSPAGQISMYIPVEPILTSPEGVGNIILKEGVRPVIERCRIAYRVS